MSKILIIDDEESIRKLIKLSLEEQGYETAEASSGSDGIQATINTHPNLIILDLGLPDGNGLEFVRKIRSWSQVPIIVLTVIDADETKVALLEAGVDDYITKPFSVPEFMARIKVAFRHAQAETATPLFESSDLSIDLSVREVYVRGSLVHLSSTEFEILRLLVKHAGRIVPQELLLTEIWGKLGSENPHYIRIYIGHLRKKLEVDASNPKHIITEVGVGYRIR